MTKKTGAPRSGAVRPRLENTPLKGITRGGEVAQLAEDIGLPLLPWQRYVLDDMLTIDKNKQFIRKTNLLLMARQNGKTHLARMRVLGGLFYLTSVITLFSALPVLWHLPLLER